MKKTLLFIVATVLTLTGCKDSDSSNDVTYYNVPVQLAYEDASVSVHKGVVVEMISNSTQTIVVDTTDANGMVVFNVPAGTYTITTTEVDTVAGYKRICNGTQSGVLVQSNTTIKVPVTVTMTQLLGSVIIKELYNGGCPTDNGSSYFQKDKCIILYNNSDTVAILANLCIGMGNPYNSQANNTNYVDGSLYYASEGYIPAANGIWYFPDTLVIQPYTQVVVNCMGAIDNTLTYSQSVNYANADYYCMYDPESGYSNTTYYPTPADVIPTSHYLKAVKYGQGNAWSLSVTSPAVFIFQTKGVTPQEYASNSANLCYQKGYENDLIYACIKVPNEWILDGMEVFSSAYTENYKRLTNDIDAGYVSLTNKLGHTLYRNVDKDATLKIEGNGDLIVYGYSADASGIDAEASLKKGAKIVYQDNNNSSTDFFEREKCSLRE